MCTVAHMPDKRRGGHRRGGAVCENHAVSAGTLTVANALILLELLAEVRIGIGKRRLRRPSSSRRLVTRFQLRSRLAVT